MTKTSIQTRCYVENPNSKGFAPDANYKTNPNSSIILVFDSETTPDRYQNLLFGSCGIWVNGALEKFYLFYGDFLKQAQIRKIHAYARKHNFEVLYRRDFVERVFYPYVYQARARCVGFNLPFDLSRLATSYGKARKFHGGFSLKFSENPTHPNIRIKSLNSKASFIEFSKPVRKKSQKKKQHYKGFFLDLKTFAFALTNKSYNLKSALNDFDCTFQKTNVEHGKITCKYLGYNINDTKSTFELYQQCMRRYETYMLQKQPNRLYSPASIGKSYLEKIGIKPFLEKNPDFPKKILGYTMMSYYGGRVECRIRKEPVKVTYLDFTSMYPSVFVLLGMYQFLVCDKISFCHSKNKTQKLLNKVSLSDINNKKTWKNLVTICKIKPDNDILPVRSRYDSKHATNIGVNYLKSIDDTCLWYTLPDLIASKLLTGKTPIIQDAITFTPNGTQTSLNQIEILKGISLQPREDFIKKLIEERLRIKESQTGKNQNIKQNILKIIANSTSYGIFIQVDRDFEGKSGRKTPVTAYGLDSFKTQVERPERQGQYFNPIISVFLTAASRLILSAAESLVLQDGGYVAYCDTDSIFVSPTQVVLVQNFFRSMNPYCKDTEMFKIEKDSENNLLHDVWFYGISSKRYVLYDYDSEKITIKKHSEHGLGHILDIDSENWWKNILKIHYHPELTEKIIQKYENKYSISQITVNTPEIIKRFEKINQNKSEKNKVKPFNFALIGTGYRKNPENNDTVIPFLPYFDKKHRKNVPYMEFVDYKTGIKFPNKQSLDTIFYWKPLSQVFLDYINHKESKLKGNSGFLSRLHLTIQKSSVHYIGKESNELEESNVIGISNDNYTNYVDIENKILQIKPSDAYKFNLSRSNLINLQKKIKNKIPIKLQNRTFTKISNHSGPVLAKIHPKKRR